MNTLIHADIFFFVTTVAVAVIAVLFIIAFVYVFKILANLRHITDRAKVEGDLIMDEVRRMRESMRFHRFGIGTIVRFIRRTVGRYY